MARERGLQPLADLILQQAHQPEPAEKTAQGFINEQVPTVEDALAGARDIAAETISDHSDVRRITREKAMQFATLKCEKITDASDEKAVYESYYQFEGQVKFLRAAPGARHQPR